MKLHFTRVSAAILVTGILALAAGARRLSSGQQPSAPAPAANLDDRGTFAISLAGRPIGTEKFTIRSSKDKIEAEAEIQLRAGQGAKSVAVKSHPQLVLDPQLEPQTYILNQKGTQEFHLEADFRVSPAVSRLRLAGHAEDNKRDFALPKDVVILDDNVVHHYQLLINRFTLKPEKKQTFNAYIPQEALPGVVTLEEVGNEEVELNGRKVPLDHLVFSAELARIDLWVDSQQHLQRFYNSESQLDAIRSK